MPPAILPSDHPTKPSLEAALRELFEQGPPNLFEQIEAAVLKAAFRYCEGNQVRTARLLGMSRNVLRARLIQFGEIPGTLRSSRSEGAPRGFSPSRGTVRIGCQRFGLLKLVRARGRLESQLLERGIKIEWVEFVNGSALVEGFRRGEVGLGIMGEGPPVLAQAARVPIVYLAAEGPAPEGEAIIVPASSEIGRVAELRGKKIALSHGANAHYLLLEALEEAGVDYTEVHVEFTTPEAARRAFEAGEVDAWGIGDPMLAELQQEAKARVLRDARGLASNPAYYVCTQAFALAHPELLEALLSELTAISQMMAEQLDEVVESLAPRVGIQKEALSVSLRRSSGARVLDDELIASQQRVADSFFRSKVISRPISVADAAWSLPLAQHKRLTA